MTVNLDAQLENADWAKQRWDLPTTPPAFLAFLGPDLKTQERRWRAFKKLPVYSAMPERLRRSISSLLD